MYVVLFSRISMFTLLIINLSVACAFLLVFLFLLIVVQPDNCKLKVSFAKAPLSDLQSELSCHSDCFNKIFFYDSDV
jgi:hypothetical protein